MDRLRDIGAAIGPIAADTIERLTTRLTEAEAEMARLRAMLVDDPDWVAAGIPDELAEIGAAVLEQSDDDFENYVSGVTTDWDYGMQAAAVFKAMLRAALTEGNQSHE